VKGWRAHYGGEVGGKILEKWWRETITQRRRGKEDAEGSEKNVGCLVGAHIYGCDMKRKDAGGVMWGFAGEVVMPREAGHLALIYGVLEIDVHGIYSSYLKASRIARSRQE
jgi:hypothetical protein